MFTLLLHVHNRNKEFDCIVFEVGRKMSFYISKIERNFTNISGVFEWDGYENKNLTAI